MKLSSQYVIEWNDIAIIDDDEVKNSMNYNSSSLSSTTLLFHLPFPNGLYNPYHDYDENEDDDYSEKLVNNNDNNIKDNDSKIDIIEWLLLLCQNYISTNSSCIFDNFQLSEEIVNLVKSKEYGLESGMLEAKLFDLIGENGFEVMLEVVQNAERIKTININHIRNKPKVVEMTYENLSLNQKKKLEKKEREKEEREKEASQVDPSLQWLIDAGFSRDYLEKEQMLGLHAGGASGNDEDWREKLAPQGTREYHEMKKGLPQGTVRTTGRGWEELSIPAAKKLQKATDDELIDITRLDDWAQKAFVGTKRLNRIQSKVFQTAFNSSENMLICAPTGAGKTNIAMLTFLQYVKQNMVGGLIDRGAIKAVYIAPMKALAQEVVSKFEERLEGLNLVVREFTGDMNLTKQEVAESHLLVSTPEKFDVVTRKGGDGSLGTMVGLIIIDEVHLLADDRGAVIETIVARTQRFVESSQKCIRIIGLSATLPNYKDVAAFLRVNEKTGLYHFGPEYRPVPLDQTLIGVTEKNRQKKNALMNELAYKKMVAALERGKQVMIFVHSRKEASKTADAMRDLASKACQTHLLENVHHEQFTIWKRSVDKSRSSELQQLFYAGLGVHHAGMLRSDRTMTERLFECGLIKVLCCTATLAWGINLPAHTVIIKGTELYDPERGGFVDLSILDVFQIFGRAGRPQYDNSGHAILITPHASLGKYVSMMGHQVPIESSFIKALADHMNAEIVNGTINNVKEASSWLSYTFLFIRMCKNPVAYGMTYDEKFADPRLDNRRIELIKAAAETLDNAMMIRYDRRSGNLAVTDLGRVASHFYIKHGTIAAFNTLLTAYLNDSDALNVLCSSAEFDQLKVRPEELQEIDKLNKTATIDIKVPLEETAGKVNVLLQGYCNNSKVESFTLQSDMNYVAQNASRICRALFEICLKRGWSTLASHYLALCKCVDKRMRMDHTPLRQFADDLPPIVIKRLEETKCDIHKLYDMSPTEIGVFCHSQKSGQKILNFVKKIPYLDIDVNVQPITRGIIRMTLYITASFDWTDRYHGFAEPFWIWVEDGENEYIYHAESFLLNKKQYRDTHELQFTIPIREPLPPQYYVRAVSDRWVGSENVVTVSFQHLILPERMPPHTNLLDMHPVPKSALQNPIFESLYKFSHFNPIQSQTFHTLYHTDLNVIVGAPTGSGKTVTCEITILRMITKNPGAKAIYVAPLKALARERLEDWQNKLGKSLGLKVLELTGDTTPDMELLKKADILVVTPEKWDSISRGWQKREYVTKVQLVIIDEIHLLGVDRGPVLEVIVSRMRFISSQTSKPIRFIGLSTALANPRDLADWLGIGEIGLYNFRPSVRPIPMTIHIQGFPGKHYCPRMATMNKPAYAAILEHSPTKPALIFVSSRRQTRLTALDLISYCASDDNPKKFLHMPEDDIVAIAETLRDSALRNTIVFGIGIHHAGLDNHDRSTIEELFLSSKIQVLVCTSTLAWGVNLPCHLVIVKGTEYYDGKVKRYVDFPVTDVLQMIGRAGRPQFDDTGVACVFVHEPKKNFYRKFLHEPFPVESSLHQQLHEHFNAEIASGSLHNVNDAAEYLTWTYFFRRLLMNPSYYGVEDTTPEGIKKHLDELILSVMKDLEEAGCIEIETNFHLKSTPLGKIASYYYLDCRTVDLFRSRLAELAVVEVNNSQTEISKNYIRELTQLLSDAFEFSELPVRHNEDILNAQLAEKLPWEIGDDEDFADSNTKAYLLLQAHFVRAPLPISDYITDTKSVMDNAPRVLNAMLDISAELGFLDIALHITTLSQMIFQGILPTSKGYQLYQVPSMTNEVFTALITRNIITLNDIMNANVEKISKDVYLQGKSQSDFVKTVKGFPKVGASIKIRSVEEGNKTDWAIKSNDCFNLPKDCECEMEITFELPQQNAADRRQLVYAPKYHKPKEMSWWVILADNNNGGNLLVLKRIGTIGNKLKTIIRFVTQTDSGNENLFLHIISDSVAGIDVKIPLNIINK